MAFYKNGYIFLCFILLTFISRLHAETEDKLLLKERYKHASQASTQTFTAFLGMFSQCILSRMAHKQFLIDNVQNFVNYPARTTVGLARKFTGNRKFFANLISSSAFKEMLAKDTEEIGHNQIKKFKYCDEVVMDQAFLKEFYDREVDQSKL